MRILILTLYFQPDLGANAVIVTELAKEFIQLDHQVTVVTGVPHYATNVTERDYRWKLFTNEEHGNLRIIRTYLYTNPQKDRFIVRLLNYVSFNLLSTLAGLFSGGYDIILAPSPPLTIGLSAAIIGFFKDIPYIYNVQDINPDVLIKLGILKNRLFIHFSKWLEKFVYKNAETVTILSEGFRQNLLGKGVPESKLKVIPNFVDPDFIKPGAKENSFRESNNLLGKFVVMYAGNLGHSQNLEDLLYCAKNLQKDSEIIFVIVGNGSRKPYLEESARQLAVKNVVFLPFQPREAVPQIYAAADLALVTLKKGIALDSVPSKIYTIMASSRPVLAAVDPGSDAWDLVQQAGCGVCLPPENPQELTKSILDLREDPDLCEQMGMRGRNYIEKHHSRKMIAEEYHQLFNRMIYGKD